jgi:hypothetical protein
MSLRSVIAGAAAALRHKPDLPAPRAFCHGKSMGSQSDAESSLGGSFAQHVFSDMQVLDAYCSLAAFAHNVRRAE